MNEKVMEILQCSEFKHHYIFSNPITTEEIYTTVKGLPNGKAPGIDGISYEYIKYGGKVVIDALLRLFNLIIESEKNPVCFKLAIKIPIPKGNKNSRSFDDHRGISLLPSINKILERIVLSRLLRELKYLHHPLQGGYQKQQDALTTCFTIEQVINQCLEEKEKVYVAYMGISKAAFDTKGINSMLFKLYHNKGICGKAWRLIRDWYIDMAEFMRIEGKSSRTYNIQQGTRQGGVFSPWLFLVFIDDLIDELQRTNAGISLNTVYLGSPMLADDLTICFRERNQGSTKCYRHRGNIVTNGNSDLILRKLLF